MFGVALVICFLVISVITAASAVAFRPLWHDAPWLASAYGLLGLGLAANLSWVFCWASRTLAIVFGVGVVAVAIVTLVVRRSWTDVRSWMPLTALSASLGAVAVGHAFMWGGLANPFITTETRYGSLPADNYLQYRFAHFLWNNLSTVHFYEDWNGSDRPPLQSGVLLLIRPLERLFGIDNGARFGNVHAMQWGLAASVIAQLMWVLGAYALLRSLRFRAAVSLLAVSFLAVTPLVVWNETFTWPKLMSAGFALAAFAILVDLRLRPDGRRTTIPITAAAALTVFAYLSHGGAAFVVPAVLVLAWVALRAHGGSLAAAGAASLASVLVLYAPWMAYTKWADPSHARLLKWHLAGHMTADNAPFVTTLVNAYERASTRYLLDARKSNLHRVFDHDLVSRFRAGNNWRGVFRNQDFFSPTFSIGLGTVLLIAMFFALVIRRSRGPVTDVTRTQALLLVTNFACMVLWALVMFLPGGALVHTGSYVWLLVLAGVPFAWVANRSAVFASCVLLAQTAYVAIVYNAPDPHLSGPVLSPAPLLVLVLGTAGTAVVLLLAFLAGRSDARKGASV